MKKKYKAELLILIFMMIRMSQAVRLLNFLWRESKVYTYFLKLIQKVLIFLGLELYLPPN